MAEVINLNKERLRRDPVTYTVTIRHEHDHIQLFIDGIPFTVNNQSVVITDLLDVIESLRRGQFAPD